MKYALPLLLACGSAWGFPQHRESDAIVAVLENQAWVFWTDETGHPIAYETAPLGLDVAATGQAADAVTAAAGVSMGFAEANPLGAAVVPVKWALLRSTVEGPVAECIAMRQALAGLGWGAAAWNLGVILGVPAVALPVAVGAFLASSGRESAIRGCVLDRIKHGS